MANKQGSTRKRFEDLRVPMNVTVKPATRAMISSWGNSRGVTIDKLVEREIERLEFNSQG